MEARAPHFMGILICRSICFNAMTSSKPHHFYNACSVKVLLLQDFRICEMTFEHIHGPGSPNVPSCPIINLPWRFFPPSQCSLTRRELATVSNEAAGIGAGVRKEKRHHGNWKWGAPETTTHSFWIIILRVHVVLRRFITLDEEIKLFWWLGQVLKRRHANKQLTVVVKKCTL